MSQPADRLPVVSPKGWLKRLVLWIGGILLGSLVAYWSGLANRAVSAGSNIIQSWLQDYVTDVVSKNLTGTLTAGQMWLRPDNPEFTFFYYCPAGHFGRIYEETYSGYSTSKQYVEYVLEDNSGSGAQRNPLKEQDVIHLNCSGTEGLKAMDIDVGVDDQLLPEINNLRAVTFSLAGTEIENTGVRVKFVAYVSPAIKMRK
jgi:hypothetical protein